MRYRINSEITIKTENAAKPAKQASTYVQRLLASLSPVASSFDLGCGKLRYTKDMLRRTDALALVDSEIQLSREQVLLGKKGTIRGIVKRSNRLSAYSVPEFSAIPKAFDRGFCINVLSAIPSFTLRRNLLTLIRSKLRVGGTCVFVAQYRNSDFTRMRSLKNSRPWKDGFIIDSLRGFSFYGIISPEQLRSMVVGAGFDILESRLNEGSVYVTARSPGPDVRRKILHVVEENGFELVVRQ